MIQKFNGEPKESAHDLTKKHYQVVLNALLSIEGPSFLSLVRPCTLAICLAGSQGEDNE